MQIKFLYHLAAGMLNVAMRMLNIFSVSKYQEETAADGDSVA